MYFNHLYLMAPLISSYILTSRMCSKYNNMQLSTVNLFLQETGVGMKITNGKIKYKK